MGHWTPTGVEPKDYDDDDDDESEGLRLTPRLFQSWVKGKGDAKGLCSQTVSVDNAASSQGSRELLQCFTILPFFKFYFDSLMSRFYNLY